MKPAVAGGGIYGTSTDLHVQPTAEFTAGNNRYLHAGCFWYSALSAVSRSVPEPSVIGLGIIGVGALFMLRRRK
jgi:hypothetical protein